MKNIYKLTKHETIEKILIDYRRLGPIIGENNIKEILEKHLLKEEEPKYIWTSKGPKQAEPKKNKIEPFEFNEELLNNFEIYKYRKIQEIIDFINNQ